MRRNREARVGVVRRRERQRAVGRGSRTRASLDPSRGRARWRRCRHRKHPWTAGRSADAEEALRLVQRGEQFGFRIAGRIDLHGRRRIEESPATGHARAPRAKRGEGLEQCNRREADRWRVQRANHFSEERLRHRVAKLRERRRVAVERDVVHAHAGRDVQAAVARDLQAEVGPPYARIDHRSVVAAVRERAAHEPPAQAPDFRVDGDHVQRPWRIRCAAVQRDAERIHSHRSTHGDFARARVRQRQRAPNPDADVGRHRPYRTGCCRGLGNQRRFDRGEQIAGDRAADRERRHAGGIGGIGAGKTADRKRPRPRRLPRTSRRQESVECLFQVFEGVLDRPGGERQRETIEQPYRIGQWSVAQHRERRAGVWRAERDESCTFAAFAAV